LRECIVCMEYTRDVIIYHKTTHANKPHLVVCHRCALKCLFKDKLCPLCRQNIQMIKSVRNDMDTTEKRIPFNQQTNFPKYDVFSLLTQLKSMNGHFI
jgi:hypothetical protein